MTPNPPAPTKEAVDLANSVIDEDLGGCSKPELEGWVEELARAVIDQQKRIGRLLTNMDELDADRTKAEAQGTALRTALEKLEENEGRALARVHTLRKMLKDCQTYLSAGGPHKGMIEAIGITLSSTPAPAVSDIPTAIVEAVGVTKSYVATNAKSRVTFEFDKKKDYLKFMNAIEEAEIKVAAHDQALQTKTETKYRCVNGHDKCNEMLPGPECPHCEKVPLEEAKTGA